MVEDRHRERVVEIAPRLRPVGEAAQPGGGVHAPQGTGPLPAVRGPPPAAGGGGAVPAGDAPRHLLHLLPGGMRRRGSPCGGGQAGIDHRRRTGGDRPHRQRRHRPPRPGRPRRPRVRPVGGRPGGGGGGAPRRDGPGVQGDRGDPVRRRVDQGGVRHRDAGVGDQHAGEGRGAGAAVQVRRRVPRGAPPRRLHPADRAGGQARHRSGRHRGGAAPGRDPVRPGGFDRRPGQPPVGVELHAHLQHGGEPGGHVPPPPRRGPGAGVVRPAPPPAASPTGNGPGR